MQHLRNDREDNQPSNPFSSHKCKTSKPCFHWLAAFIPPGMQSVRGKTGQDGQVCENCLTHPCIGQTNNFQYFINYATGLTRNYGTVKLTQLYYLWHIICLCDGLAVRPAASADENLAVTLRNSLLVVYQRGKRDFIHLIGGLHHMVHYRWTGMSRVS